MFKYSSKIAKISVISLTAATLIGCQNVDNEGVGTITGGVVGGLLGSQVGGGTGAVVATVGGAILGAFLGNSVGRKMDEVDKMKLNAALEKSPSGHTTSWKNPDNGSMYAVTPMKTTHNDNGQPCREYSFDATIGGKTKQVYGTACRDASGAWKAIS